jgi:hypothetical protein
VVSVSGRTRIPIPGPGTTAHPRNLKGAERDGYDARREVHGATHEILPSLQRQEGDASYGQHGVPEEFDRPSMVDLLPSAPRMLPVSQDVEHGPAEDRDAAFWLAIQQAHDLGAMHGACGLGLEVALGPSVFRDRRFWGRRHRPGFDDAEASQPYAPADAPADMEWIRFVRGY